MEKAKIDSRSISMRNSSSVDVLPYVLTIIAPDVGRAAGYDFMSQNESKVLKRAVDVTRVSRFDVCENIAKRFIR